MKILHTADWHLGRIFHGLHLTNEQQNILRQLTALIKHENIQVVLIAGDIYDRAVPPTEAVNLLDATLSTWINQLHVSVIMIAGNHDNPRRLGFGTDLFAASNLYIYGPVDPAAHPIVLTDDYGPVYFAPLTYCDPLEARELASAKISTHEEALAWQIQNMLAQIPSNARKVALAHVFLTGATTTPDSERPLAIGGTTTVSIDNFQDFNYTALGHLHACQKCSDSVRYSGSLMKYSFNEVHQTKAVQIVDLSGDGSITVTTYPLQAERELACLEGEFADLVAHPRTELQEDYLQVTLTDKAPVLDAKNRLEKIYPHILQLGYARLELDPDATTAAPSDKLTPQALFAAFFRQTAQRDLTAAEAELVATALNAAEQAERRS